MESITALNTRKKQSKEQKPHILRASKTTPLPSELLFLDTETNVRPFDTTRKVHSLKLGICQYYKRVSDREIEIQSERVFTSKSEFYAWLYPRLSGRKTFYLIAHNIGYDAMILDAFRELPKAGFKLESMYSKAQVTIIRWRKDRTALVMLDNGNFFQGSLERWGKIFNFPKLSINFETCTMEELEIYCRRDVEIMVKSWSVWFDFLNSHDCGGFRLTVGSTAFNTWRHAYMPIEPFVHKDPRVLLLERDAYHGGRVECFYQGTLSDGPYYYLDINNMYGFVMLNNEYPIGLQGYSQTLPIKRMITYLMRYSVIANVNLNVDVPIFVTKVNGYTAYPLGRFSASLTTHELILALQNGWIEKVNAMSWYKKAPIFEGYVSHFYDLRMKYRKDHNEGFEQITKLLINSLYGKFGQTGLRQEIIGKAGYDEIWSIPVYNISNDTHSRQIAIGGSVIEEFKEGESFHSMPAIAAHVTANARLYLYKLIVQAGWENVYYTDTDSLITNQTGYDRLTPLLSENDLGKLKVEISSPSVEILAAKEYRMGERTRLKGIRSNAIEVEPNVYLQEKWPKLAGAIRAGIPEFYMTESVYKKQLRRVRSGIVLPSGIVKPFQLE